MRWPVEIFIRERSANDANLHLLLIFWGGNFISGLFEACISSAMSVELFWCGRKIWCADENLVQILSLFYGCISHLTECETRWRRYSRNAITTRIAISPQIARPIYYALNDGYVYYHTTKTVQAVDYTYPSLGPVVVFERSLNLKLKWVSQEGSRVSFCYVRKASNKLSGCQEQLLMKWYVVLVSRLCCLCMKWVKKGLLTWPWAWAHIHKVKAQG